jgi:hypothetical protein
MQQFTVHWSPVPGAASGVELFALWPSPVNADACFQAAGFTEFGDGDEKWDENADGMLSRLLVELAAHGPPRLISKPVERPQPWYRRWLAPPEMFDLRQQIEFPMHLDQLSDCVVNFGGSGASLRTGNGHHIFWITLPHANVGLFPSIVTRVAGSHPTVRTSLKWEFLI